MSSDPDVVLVEGTPDVVVLDGVTVGDPSGGGVTEEWVLAQIAAARTARVVTDNAVSGTYVIDFAAGDWFLLNMTAPTTFSFANFNPGDGVTVFLTGAFAATWPTTLWQPSQPTYVDGLDYEFWMMQTGTMLGSAIVGSAAAIAAAVAVETARAQAAETALASAPAGGGVYGDGSDGAVIFDGTSTVLGMVPSGSVYTLTRDIFLADGATINTGVTIGPAGFRIFCAGNLVNNGTINYNGFNGSNGTSSAGGAGGGALAQSGTLGSANTGKGGSSGGTTTGSAGTASSPSLGGSGGHGGAGASAGGIGGAATAPTAAQGTLRSLPQAVVGLLMSGALALVQALGGASGAGGGGDGTAGGGGGGGGAGGILVAALTISGTGSITANGGHGGNAFASSANAGGGGGGGGGWIVVVSRSVSSGAIVGQTITASGGAAGTDAGTGGGSKTAGSAGTVILLPN